MWLCDALDSDDRHQISDFLFWKLKVELVSSVGQARIAEKAATPDPPFFISVVIVNYNGASHLERCLASLARQTYPHFETIMVDNASTDGSADWVAAHIPQVHLIRSGRNLGFAAGNNLGIREAQGELDCDAQYRYRS